MMGWTGDIDVGRLKGIDSDKEDLRPSARVFSALWSSYVQY